MDSSVLPPELERELFETAAMMYPEEIPTLLRVARRILTWSIQVSSPISKCHLIMDVQDRAAIIQSRLYAERKPRSCPRPTETDETSGILP
jgi:hypothetical protein